MSKQIPNSKSQIPNKSHKQDLILVNKQGRIKGQEEKWKVHKEGILHKGFSLALFYKGKIILQRRKHPVFNKTTDFTASSHPVMMNNKPQDEERAASQCLKREWNIKKKDLRNFKKLGSFVYKATDKKGFTEHELCTIYRGDINFLPFANFEFAYGFEVVEFSFLKKNQNIFPLAPWVTKALHLLNF